jgi:hypothetical protein
MSTRKGIVILFIMSFIFFVLGFVGPRVNLDFAWSFLGGGNFMWIFLLFIVIGVGTIIGFLKEQSKQNKRIIELLEEIKQKK